MGFCLLQQAKYPEAEPPLRECLAMREKELPGSWLRWNATSVLGEALGEGKHAVAEPLLLDGYEKLVPPVPRAHRNRESLERIARLYEAWGKPEKAAEWKARLEAGDG